jgi:hypothetical protein
MSGGIEASRVEQDLKALENFLVGNEGLDRLEALLDRFNIFEAIGMVYRELNHSQFLAYLLDPRGNHGLGDLFVKRFLQKVQEEVVFHRGLPKGDLFLELDRRNWIPLYDERNSCDMSDFDT